MAKRYQTLPTKEALKAIPAAQAGEYELNEKQMKQLRSRIYALNKDNGAGWRWRTMREGRLLYVWRIH